MKLEKMKKINKKNTLKKKGTESEIIRMGIKPAVRLIDFQEKRINQLMNDMNKIIKEEKSPIEVERKINEIIKKQAPEIGKIRVMPKKDKGKFFLLLEKPKTRRLEEQKIKYSATEELSRMASEMPNFKKTRDKSLENLEKFLEKADKSVKNLERGNLTEEEYGRKKAEAEKISENINTETLTSYEIEKLEEILGNLEEREIKFKKKQQAKATKL